MLRKSAFHLLFRLPKSSFGLGKFHAPQTKIWEGLTKKKSRFSIYFSMVRSPNRVLTSRRKLTPVFDKPAFSRFSQIFQPRLVVHSFGKIVKRQVCVKNDGELPTAVGEGCIFPPKRRFRKPNKPFRMLRSECFSKHFSKGVRTRFGLTLVEKCFEEAFGKVCSASEIFVWGSMHFQKKNVQA